MKNIISLLLLLLLLTPGVAPAADQPISAYDATQPINVTADRLEADDLAQRVRFIGNVVAKQGDFTIYAATLTMFYHKGSKDIERAEAEGDVRIVQGARVATGRKGIFYREEGKVVLSGDARVHQGEDFVQGDEITVLLGEEKSIVEGREGSRVNAIFHPKEKRP